jgi:hypothetical protein
MWDAVTGQPSGPLLKFDANVKVLAFSPDARTVLTAHIAAGEGNVRL